MIHAPAEVAGGQKEREERRTRGRGEEKKKARRGQVNAVSTQESGPVYTEKHNVWESSNNAQRPSHNAPGASRGSGLLGNHVGRRAHPPSPPRHRRRRRRTSVFSAFPHTVLSLLAFFARLPQPSKSGGLSGRCITSTTDKGGGRETSSRRRSLSSCMRLGGVDWRS